MKTPAKLAQRSCHRHEGEDRLSLRVKSNVSHYRTADAVPVSFASFLGKPHSSDLFPPIAAQPTESFDFARMQKHSLG
jgi:hypothetical protein